MIDQHFPQDQGDQEYVLDYQNLAEDVREGDFLLLNDGLISVKVEEIQGTQVITRCVVGGELKSNKGINVRGGGCQPVPTEKDIQDLEYGCKLGADYIALSFVKQAQDIHLQKS